MSAQKASSRQILHSVLLTVAAFAGGAAAVFLLQRRRQAALQQRVANLEEEQAELRRQNAELQTSLVPEPPVDLPVETPVEKTPLPWKRIALLVLILLLAAAGPVLVMLERWFYLPDIRELQRELWCKSDLLCQTVLPSYFLIVIPAFVLAVLLFIRFNRRNPAAEEVELSASPTASGTAQPALPAWQLKTSRILEVLAASGAALVFLLAVFANRAPAAEFPLIVLMYLLGSLFKGVSFEKLRTLPGALPKWVLPFLFSHLCLILLLRSVNGHPQALLTSAALTAASVLIVFPYRRQVPLVLWVVNLAVVLYTALLQSWRYGIIGDEYIFYHYGRIVLNEHNLNYVLRHVLNARTVIYSKFQYLSTLPHAVSMLLLGKDNFGWRFANLYLAGLAIPFFYAFLKDFLSRRTALIFAVLYAVSHYLVSFSRIGYNNVQSLLGMAVTLWLAGKAIRSGKDLYYTLLGMALGVCMYIYPAVLAVLPLPLLLLLFLNPPYRSRAAFRQWMLVISGFSLLFLPLIFEPDYWQQKMSESAIDTPGISSRFHILSNLLYSLFSFLYNPEESHYVVSSYVDPLSGILVVLGLGWVLRRARREKFMRFLLAALVFVFFSLGASRSRALPSVTHMFLILPVWFILAALGADWLLGLVRQRKTAATVQRVGLFLLALLTAFNLVQTFVISPMRSDRYHSLEALFLRFLQQQSRPDQLTNQGRFLFITDKSWDIYGFHSFRDAYQLPPSQTQLLRAAIQDEPFYPFKERILLPVPAVFEDEDLPMLELETWAVELAMQPDTVVILKPWLTDYEILSVALLMKGIGKQPCPIRSAPGKDPIFTLWLDSSRMDACPRNGIWSRFW